MTRTCWLPSTTRSFKRNKSGYYAIFQGKENILVLDSMLPWLIPLFLFRLSNACAIFMLNTNSYINKVMAFNYRGCLGEQVALLWDQPE